MRDTLNAPCVARRISNRFEDVPVWNHQNRKNEQNERAVNKDQAQLRHHIKRVLHLLHNYVRNEIINILQILQMTVDDTACRCHVEKRDRRLKKIVKHSIMELPALLKRVHCNRPHRHRTAHCYQKVDHHVNEQIPALVGYFLVSLFSVLVRVAPVSKPHVRLNCTHRAKYQK